MIGTRVALPVLFVTSSFLGCAVAPGKMEWTNDLAVAKARASVDRLVIVHFTLPDGSPAATRAAAMERELDASAEVRASVAGHETVRLVATQHPKAFRAIFDTAPRLAACVMDRDGLVVAARLGHAPCSDFVRFVRQAEEAYSLVATLSVDLKKLPMRGQRASQRRSAFLLAEAYLVSGNPFAAYKHFTLVTLLDSGDKSSRDEVIRACERLARIEVDRGNHREAREWLGHLEEENPGGAAHRSEVQLTEAMIAMAERRVQDAHAILSRLRADESNEEVDRVWFEYGRACHESGRDEDAKRAFTTVVSRFPDSRWRDAAAAELSHTGASDHSHEPGTTHRHKK
jgi:tetratricopeptide (TPR) repeat protein